MPEPSSLQKRQENVAAASEEEVSQSDGDDDEDDDEDDDDDDDEDDSEDDNQTSQERIENLANIVRLGAEIRSEDSDSSSESGSSSDSLSSSDSGSSSDSDSSCPEFVPRTPTRKVSVCCACFWVVLARSVLILSSFDLFWLDLAQGCLT
jgi:hypothetical protein